MVRQDKVQALLPFQEFEEERKARIAMLKALPRYEHPANDKQEYMELQWLYYNEPDCRKETLARMFTLLSRVALKLTSKQMKHTGFTAGAEAKEEIAVDASLMFLDQVEKNELVIRESFVSYLFLMVRKAMYYRSEGEIFEQWLVENQIDFFRLPEEEKLALKVRFKDEYRKSRNEGHNRNTEPCTDAFPVRHRDDALREISQG